MTTLAKQNKKCAFLCTLNFKSHTRVFEFLCNFKRFRFLRFFLSCHDDKPNTNWSKLATGLTSGFNKVTNTKTISKFGSKNSVDHDEPSK